MAVPIQQPKAKASAGGGGGTATAPPSSYATAQVRLLPAQHRQLCLLQLGGAFAVVRPLQPLA